MTYLIFERPVCYESSQKLTAWALLAEIVHVPEARRAFSRGKGSSDLEAIILWVRGGG